jgi:hypothetical protein
VDTDTLAQRMLDEGYLIAPGSVVPINMRRPTTLMRINFATAGRGVLAVFGRLRDGA